MIPIKTITLISKYAGLQFSTNALRMETKIAINKKCSAAKKKLI